MSKNIIFIIFTEEKPPGSERFKMLDTVDRDDLDVEEAASLVCYFIVGGDQNKTFDLHPVTHELQVSSFMIFK